MKRSLPVVAVCSVLAGSLACPVSGLAADLPSGYMPQSQSERILDKTLQIQVDPDLEGLSEAERETVGRLVAVGELFQRIHETSRHRSAREAYRNLAALDQELGSPQATQNLLTLYYLFKGPIARTLDNTREPFLPVEARAPGGSLYPWGVTRSEIDGYLEERSDARARMLDLRTVVRRATREAAEADLAVLDRHPVLDTLHPGLRSRLERAAGTPDENGFYAIPYALAFADDLTEAYRLLMEAGELMAPEDPEFSHYLGNRARDLLSNDYESGDASWVTGHFNNLNAQIGAYETYDDELYGVKAFFGLNVLLRDREASAALRKATNGMQAFENSLPYQPDGWDGGNKKTVREDIPVGVYNIVADFGQSRGTNTATILPNESEYARKYGRTILLRSNIMRNPDLFAIRRAAFQAAVADEFHGDLAVDGGFYRTLWHEIGHYLGPDRTRDGRDLDEALETLSSVFEELKADLVSLYLSRALEERGYYDAEKRRAVYASGIRRVLLKSLPQRSQPYQTMELMQLNYYLEHGLLDFDDKTERLVIHYDRYHDVVTAMLGEVLELQYDGDADAAGRFVDTYTTWRTDLHDRLARSMKASETYRYAYVTYGILEKPGP
jgi:hypothetical protein